MDVIRSYDRTSAACLTRRRGCSSLVAVLRFPNLTEVQLPDNIVCNSTLWAACIGGASQQDSYRSHIEATGSSVIKVEDNPQYQLISDNSKGQREIWALRAFRCWRKKSEVMFSTATEIRG